VNELLVVVAALAVSVAVIPLMIRLAPMIGMIDQPDPRKVHLHPVPRVGGIGMALGALAAIMVVAPTVGWVWYYVFGALVLLVFGALDDAMELGHYVKFIGQFVAVVPLVWLGDVWVANVPFVGFTLPPEIGKPFTAIAIVGVINAINHSDGLDGLAGGETVLSLACVAYLAHLAGDPTLVLLCFAVLGGVFGFLRFNTHPARVFMGDAGSQFLGFSLAVCVVVLTQKSDTSVSMALPLLAIGLPIIDILAVFYLRARAGLSWFKATRNHIHHRLLGLGFDHYQAVVAIYAVQAFFVVAAILFRYESDFLVASLYLVPCAALFLALTSLERTGWKARRGERESRLSRLLGGDRAAGIADLLVKVISIAIPVYFVAGALSVRSLPDGTGFALAAIVAMLAAALTLPWRYVTSALARVAIYSLAPLWVYAVERQIQAMAPALLASMVPFYALIAVTVALVWKLSREQEFKATPMDFLIAVVAVATTFLAGSLAQSAHIAALVIKIVVLLYACELIFTRASARAADTLTLVAAGSAVVALVRTLP